jgi:hypothetical protein
MVGGSPSEDLTLAYVEELMTRRRRNVLRPQLQVEDPPVDYIPIGLISIPKQYYLLVLLIGFRILNSLIVVTWFDPDETWQATEVAHNIVFGFGYVTW